MVNAKPPARARKTGEHAGSFDTEIRRGMEQGRHQNVAPNVHI